MGSSATLAPIVNPRLTFHDYTVSLNFDFGTSNAELESVLSNDIGFEKITEEFPAVDNSYYKIKLYNESEMWIIRIGGEGLEHGGNAKSRSVLLDSLLTEYLNAEAESEYQKVLGAVRNEKGQLLAILLPSPELLSNSQYTEQIICTQL